MNTEDTKMKHRIALAKGLVIIPETNKFDNQQLAATVQAKLIQYGYILDMDALTALSKCDREFITEFHDSAIEYLKDILGGNFQYTPIYRNFPEEVMEMSELELFINAFMHYRSNGEWVPYSQDVNKPVKMETGVKYTTIKLGREEDFLNIFTKLVSINTSLPPQDLKIVEWFVTSGQKLILPNEIPFKETLCVLVSLGVNGLPIKTVTDVLRIATYLSGGEVTLPNYRKNKEKRTKFKKFKRSMRKHLLALMEETNLDVREMVLHRDKWLRLGEILHPGEFAGKYKRAFEAFQKIRNEKVVSWYGELNKSEELGLAPYLEKLSERPGEFARRLDSVLRKYSNYYAQILVAFSKVAQKVSNKVLFELINHFSKRNEVTPRRVFTKTKSRTGVELDTLEPLDKVLLQSVDSLLRKALSAKFSELERLGSCWIDPDLTKIPLPKNLRSLSEASKIQIRGQRIPFGNENTKVIRAFLHWTDTYGNVDLDLSATFLTEGGSKTDLSFQSLKSGNSVHSGDVRHRKGACAEYVDIDINDAKKRGYRYVVFDARDYEKKGFNYYDSIFGLMEREHPAVNTHWLPETITFASKLFTEGMNVIVSMFDLEKMEYIFIDMDSEGSRTASGDTNILKLVEGFSSEIKFSVYDLLHMHAQSRGLVVVDPEHAETVFTYKDFSESYEKTAMMMGI